MPPLQSLPPTQQHPQQIRYHHHVTNVRKYIIINFISNDFLELITIFWSVQWPLHSIIVCSKCGMGPQPRASDPATPAEQHVFAATVQRTRTASDARQYSAAPWD